MDRDEHLDSIKGLLILLVVFGHLIEPIRADSWIMHTYKFIYVFHMPAFIFLSGMLTHGPFDERHMRKLVSQLIVPLIVFECLYVGLHRLLHGHYPADLSNLTGYWVLWFLVSLFFWRLLAPILLRLRWPVLASLVIALIGQAADHTGSYLSLGRTFTFLPFFTAGLVHGQTLITRIRQSDGRRVAILLLIVIFILSAYPRRFALAGDQSFEDLGLLIRDGVWLRLALYAMSFTAVCAVIRLTKPSAHLARWGRQSLDVYVWHGLLIMLLRDVASLDWLRDYSFFVFIAFIPLSILLCQVLSAPAVATATRSLFLPVRRLLLPSPP